MVAGVLLGLGAEAAGLIFQHFRESEISRVATGAREMRTRPPSDVSEALRRFVSQMERVGAEAAASDEVLREFAAQALGSDVVRRAFDGEIPPPQPDEVLGPIAHADPEALAMILARERPQMIALVLSSLDADRAVEVLARLDETVRAEVLHRVATVESVSPDILREVGRSLWEQLQIVVAGGMRRIDGKAAALELLRRRPTPEQNEVVSFIEENDPELADELRARLFTFSDLLSLSDRDIQAVLKEVDNAQLTLALKGASEELRDRILGNMSARAAEMLVDDIAVSGPVRMAEAEKAQAAIAKLALELADQGKVTIIRAADQVVG
ncbi:MAG TPA: flagellar motor switch protein FliG [Vulgatibacter sp.]|nr:flagellar motor switch protein FliG [Vulgatibacter sp.]